jgi:hypothetical protein
MTATFVDKVPRNEMRNIASNVLGNENPGNNHVMVATIPVN